MRVYVVYKDKDKEKQIELVEENIYFEPEQEVVIVLQDRVLDAIVEKVVQLIDHVTMDERGGLIADCYQKVFLSEKK